jgi:hypothetical protein
MKKIKTLITILIIAVLPLLSIAQTDTNKLNLYTDIKLNNDFSKFCEEYEKSLLNPVDYIQKTKYRNVSTESYNVVIPYLIQPNFCLYHFLLK